MSPTLTAAAAFREVGLMPDGPLPWGRRVPGRGPGVFIVELDAPVVTAPIELARVGKWLERVPTLQVDGVRPSTKALGARLASFWLPDQVILYVGATSQGLGARVDALATTSLGDRRPHPGGHWLHTLTVLARTRTWWAGTDAVEEYEDALLQAFEEAARPDVADPTAAGPLLPFANLRRPTGERRASGITGSLLPDTAPPPPPATRVTIVPDGDAEGARGEPPTRRRVRATASSTRGATAGPAAAGSTASGSAVSDPPAATMTADGATRLQAELDELIAVRRPEVIARIRAAKELGDLKENADYTAAREEQSFLEGRIQALEARLRSAVVGTAPGGDRADLGSVVSVEIDGESTTYTLVGRAEADARSGRISVASPVGQALLGSRAGDEVIVETPRGPVTYRVIDLA